MQTLSRTSGAPVKVLIVITYLVMIGTNVLANALPINGRSTGEVSDSYPNLFAPAGVTFSVWGVIYLLLAAHVLYQLGLFQQRDGEAAGRPALLQRVGVLFSVSSLVNASWLVTWHYDLILLSTVLLVTLLVLLILITRTLLREQLTLREKIFVRLPFSVYFGWVTVATIANVTIWLVSIGWDGFGVAEPTWAVIILAVGAMIAVAVILRDRDPAYALVLIWAYFGIWLKHNAADGWDGAYPQVGIAALVGVAAFAISALVAILSRRGRQSQEGAGGASGTLKANSSM